MTEYERKRIPLRMVPGAVLLGWEFDTAPDGLIGEDTLVSMRRRKTPMDKPLWSEDASA